LIQIPHAFFERENVGPWVLTALAGWNTVWAWSSFQSIRMNRLLCEGIIEKVAREEGLTVLGWRDTPINGNMIGRPGSQLAAVHRADFYQGLRQEWIRTPWSANYTSCVSAWNRLCPKPT